jgi:hypothetical protein
MPIVCPERKEAMSGARRVTERLTGDLMQYIAQYIA